MRMCRVGIAVFVALALTAQAQPPLLMNYQGRLLSGTNLAQGFVEMRLRLYPDAVGGAPLYEDTGTVLVVDGVYSTQLGDGTAAGDLVAALNQPAIYLETVVNGTALTPRERLASVPYALQSLAAVQHTESDPQYAASVAASISATHTARWELAYQRGDHATNGYLTSFAETDPVWGGASNLYYQRTEVDAAFATGMPVYAESDPAFSASVAAGITSAETSRWELAYQRGDHATNGYLTGFTENDPVWAAASNAYYTAAQADSFFATGTPVYAESDPLFATSVAAGITSAETSRWDIAYQRGDHATNGYLTSYTETDPLWSGASNLYYQRSEVDAVFATGTPVYAESDPVFGASVAAGITSADTSRWESAYGWGDHGVAGYLTSFTENDPVWAAASNAYYTAAQADAVFATGTPVYAESDPVFATSIAAGITSTETSRWELAYQRGDHATNGYLTNFMESDPIWSGASNQYYLRTEADAAFATGTPVYAESDPVFGASIAAGITSADTSRWESAYGWGDHGVAGYLTSFTENDPVWTAASNAYYTAAQADAVFATGTPVYAESDPVFATSIAAGITSTETSRWELAYQRGDHATNGYLTGYTETDPTWGGASNLYYQRSEVDAAFATGTPVYVETDPAFSASVAAGITSAETSRWELAYQRGDHATNGYLTGFTETDPTWGGASNLYYQRSEVDAAFATGTPVYVETDPTFGASVAASLTSAETSRWELAYQRGDHATNGYLTGFTESDPVWTAASNQYYLRTEADAVFATGMPVYAESDPVFGASVAAGITSADTSRWETAFGWGDHGVAGYLTSYTETDPIWSGASNLYYRRAEADALFATGMPVYAESDPQFAASAAALITPTATSRWETAFAWGNHATNGFITGAGASNTFVRKAGDTMTGPLALPSGGLAVGVTQLVVLANGNVGIGTATPTNQLAVNGSIKAREVIVTANNWPDYVFDDTYRLAPLSEVRAFIDEHGHLPGVPSAAQVEREGVPLGEFGAALLRKIEELTLHQMALERENERLRRDLDALRSQQPPVAP